MTTIPRRYRKTGSRLTLGHSLDSRTDNFNESGLSGSQNADLTHLALYAGGIVGSSLQSAASGFPTGSAGFVSSSMKAFSRSQENSSSASESFSSTFASSIRGVDLTLSSLFSLSSLGVRWRELDEERVPGPWCRRSRPRWCLSLPRPDCLFLPPLSRSLRRSRWSLGRELLWPAELWCQL